MKKLMSLFLLCHFLHLQGQVKSLGIGEQTFVMEHVLSQDLDIGWENTTLYLHKSGAKKEEAKIQHILQEREGDHNSESLQLGSYEVSGDSLILYSFWCRRGDAPVSPYGARVQTYILRDSRLALHESIIYLETTRIDWAETVGIKFLFENPTNEQEKKEYMQYVKEVEAAYNAKFVYGKQADRLLKRVKLRMADKIEKETKGWHEIESSFGVKM